ncbi:MAG: hypothetical protein ACYDG4_10660 [Desulfuromonadaceae bacterium]
MSEEYRALKAQYDKLEKLSQENCMKQGAAAERARIREAVKGMMLGTVKSCEAVFYNGAINEVLSLLKDGDG